MPERRGRERLFEIDPVKRPQGSFWRLIISKYVGWVQAFGYVFCAAVAAGIVVCWICKTDEVAREKEVGKSLIKPHEEAVTHTKDAVVTRVAVKEWEHVTDWAPVVEVCDDPDWIARYKVIQQLDTFADAMHDLEKTAPLPPAIAKQVADADKEVEAWNKGPAKKATLTLLLAPIEGEVLGTQDLAGKFFKAGETVCKVVNFSDLRIAIKLSGNNVERVRVGMPAEVTVTPDYGGGCVVRADAKRGRFATERVQFNYALDGKQVKGMLLDWWKKQAICSKEDTRQSVALPPSEVEEAEVTCTLAARPLSPTEAANAPKTDIVEVDDIGSQNPMRGVVISGKHTGSYNTNFLSPEMEARLEEMLAKSLKGKVVRLPADPKSPPLRIEGASDIHNFLKLKAVVPDLAMEESERSGRKAGKAPAKKETPKEITVSVVDEKPGAMPAWKLMRAGMDERFALSATTSVEADKGDRFFEGAVRISNPSPSLVEKVKEAYQKSPAAYLKAKVEIVVGECRVAMLLFRQ